MSGQRIYRASVGDTQLDVSIENGKLSLEGSEKQAIVHRVSENNYVLLLDGASFDVYVESADDGTCALYIGGARYEVRVQDERDLLLQKYGIANRTSVSEKEVRAPMPGLVLDVLVSAGQRVENGKGLIVLEAMKMENEIRATSDSTVAIIHVKPGDAVSKGDLLLEFSE